MILDEAQKKVACHFDALSKALLKRSWFRKAPLGIYLWGPVGCGKTFLMDRFFHALPFAEKERLHFHRFMLFVHQSLKAYQGQANPIKKIAQNFAKHARILCFDEFYVSDIADAMILANLLKALFSQGVTLVATSNLSPHALYANGLQRDKFLPAIDLINHHTRVLEMKSSVDYRLAYFSGHPLYHVGSMDNAFERHHEVIVINDRKVLTEGICDNAVWFSFAVLCQSARHTHDYIEIARCYRTVYLSDVPIMRATDEDAARRFIALVDEFYERHVILIISAAAPLTAIYQGNRYRLEFQRTISRLTEMQSKTYLEKPHLP